MKKTNFIAALFVPFVCACSNESLDQMAESAIAPIPQVRSFADTSYVERGSCEFLYHGKRYASTYTVINDSICEYDNKEVRDFIESHIHQKELHIFVHNDGQLEYFDTEDEMTRALESEQKHRTRSSKNPWDLYRYEILKEADLELYEDSRWKGKALFYHLGSQDIVEVADLGTEKFDNKLSAFRLNPKSSLENHTAYGRPKSSMVSHMPLKAFLVVMDLAR